MLRHVYDVLNMDLQIVCHVWKLSRLMTLINVYPAKTSIFLNWILYLAGHLTGRPTRLTSRCFEPCVIFSKDQVLVIDFFMKTREMLSKAIQISKIFPGSMAPDLPPTSLHLHSPHAPPPPPPAKKKILATCLLSIVYCRGTKQNKQDQVLQITRKYGYLVTLYLLILENKNYVSLLVSR